MWRAEAAPRPFDRGLGLGVHALGIGGNGVVVVAEHDRRTLPRKLHHGIGRPFGIGAITDDVAEADDPLRTAGTRELETRAERLPVGVYIGKDGKPHVFPPHPSSRSCLRVS